MSTAALTRIHWTAWAVVPAALSIMYRKRGGFYVRTAVTFACIAIATLYGVFASLTYPLFGKAHLLNWTVARIYYHLAGHLLGLSVTIEGKEHIRPERPAVYVSNHQASLDLFYMASVFPKATAVVAKKSLKYVPFLGWYMILSKAIFLDRANRESAVKQARQAATDIHKNQTSVWLFPEGTRGRPTELGMLPFKKGAFYMAVQARVPIVPVIIGNYNHLYDSKKRRFLSGNIKIKVLPPVSTEGIPEESAAIDALTNKVRDMMIATLKEISTCPSSPPK